jgi:hypothetical protein
MNQSENSTISNFVLVLDEAFFLHIGSTWTIDSIYLFVFPPLALSAFILNLISFFVLNKIKINQTKLYKYLKVYSLNMCLISLILSVLFLCFSPRYFGFFREPLGKWFQCRIFAYGLFSLYSFCNVLDFVIVSIRLSIFIPKLKFVEKYKPYILSFALFLCCFLINAPILFILEMISDQELLNSKSRYYCALSEFGKSDLGFILNAINIVIRDIFTFIIELIMSLLAIYYFYKFEAKKRSTQAQCIHQIPMNDIINRNNADNNDQPSIIIDQQHHDFGRRDLRNDNIQPRSQDKATTRFILMTISISVPSFIINLLIAVSFLLYSVSFENESIFLYYSMNLFGLLCMALKSFFNIFIFYFFNLNFKTEFKKAFKRRQQ